MMDDIDNTTRNRRYVGSHTTTSKPTATTRRHFLRNSGGLAALSALPPVFAKPSEMVEAAVLFRWDDQYSKQFAETLNAKGVAAIALQDDLVRQWRDELHLALTEDKKIPIIGLTNWSDFLMMRELTAEIRRYPLIEVQLSAQQYDQAEVLNQYAHQLLSAAKQPKNRKLQNSINQLSSNNRQSRSLFAWVIA